MRVVIGQQPMFLSSQVNIYPFNRIKLDAVGKYFYESSTHHFEVNYGNAPTNSVVRIFFLCILSVSLPGAMLIVKHFHFLFLLFFYIYNYQEKSKH